MKKTIEVCDLCGREVKTIADGLKLRGQDAAIEAPDGKNLTCWDGGSRTEPAPLNTNAQTHEAVWCWRCFDARTRGPEAKAQKRG